MPRVSRVTSSINGHPWVREIRVNTKGIFSIKLPPEMAEAPGDEEVTAPTQAAVLDALEDALDRYQAAQTATRKVIAYDFACVMRIVQLGGQCTFSQSGISFCEGAAIQLAAAVYEEHVTQLPAGKKHYRYTPVKSAIPTSLEFRERSGPRDYAYDKPYPSLLPFTPEREAFFVRMGQGMEQLAVSLHTMFSSTENLDAAIAAAPRPLALL